MSHPATSRLDATYYMSRPLPLRLAERLEREMREATELSERKLDILALYANGYTYREIGEKLHISHHTVQSHYARICDQLNARGMTNAVAIAMKRGILDPELIA